MTICVASGRSLTVSLISAADFLGDAASADVKNFLRTTTLMYRVQYDFTEHEKYSFQPYVSGGLGFAHHKIDYSGEGEDDAVIAYQLGTGLMWEFGPLNYIVAEYRYLASKSADFDGVSIDYAAHEFRLGVLMGF
jgi:opacity protein-like surface antigen